MDTLALPEAGPPQSLLQSRKPIYAETGGQVPVSYHRALEVLQRTSPMTGNAQA